MNKMMFSFAVLFVISALGIKAQRCSYYALTKKVCNNIQTTNVSGGQFISFIDDICYESDIKRIGVGHGTLKLNKNYSNGSFKVYMGDSYWGSNTTFKFKSDLSVLNVILESGEVYVYKRQPAPSSITTCSLIRKKKKEGSGGYTPVYPVTPVYSGSSNTPITSSTPRQNTTPAKRQPTTHTCSLCNGQKRIVKDTHPPLYGAKDYQVRCNECGESFPRSWGHTHVTCPQCHGKGYFTTD